MYTEGFKFARLLQCEEGSMNRVMWRRHFRLPAKHQGNLPEQAQHSMLVTASKDHSATSSCNAKQDGQYSCPLQQPCPTNTQLAPPSMKMLG
jgi:hypothetical protein